MNRSIGRGLQEYLRGIAGGVMFSLPLLYTMKVWWASFTMHPLRLLLYVLATFTLLLGYNRYAGFATSAKTPANIELELGKQQSQANRFIIPVLVTNSGDTTAETVQIEVTLENSGKEQESAQLEIDFLPRHSKREGWVTFQTDPRTVQETKARVLGFEQP